MYEIRSRGLALAAPALSGGHPECHPEGCSAAPSN